jgi:hypothetical protein
MKKKIEDIEMVVDGTTVEQTPVVETQAVSTSVVTPAFTATKTIREGLKSYEVDAPKDGKAKLTVSSDLGTGKTKTTIKLIDLSEAEFADEALLKAKLIK